MINRSLAPEIRSIDKINITTPLSIVMPNGIHCQVIRAGKEDVVRVDIIFGSGKWDEAQPMQALFCNRMLREGSARYSSSEIAEQLDFYGAWLELTVGSRHSYITLYSLNKYFQQTFAVLSSLLLQPTFDEKRLETVIGNNLQLMHINMGKVNYMAHRAFRNCIFGDNHPNGVIVTDKSYNDITRECLLDFFKKNYHFGNCSIYLAGNVTDNIISHVEKVLGTDAWGDTTVVNEHKSHEIHTTKDKRRLVSVANTMQSCVIMGYPIIGYAHPDSYKLKVLMTVLGGYFGSRLVQNIREEKGYTYGIAGGITNSQDTGVLIISSETATEHVDDLIREVYHEMDVLQNELISDSELNMVRNYMTGDLCRSYEGAFAQSDAWIFIDTNYLNKDYFQLSLEAIRSVRPDELKQLAQRYFDSNKMIEVVAGN